MKALEEAGLPRDPLLDSVKIPDGFGYLWSVFWEVRRGSSDGFGGVRITWRDLAAYGVMTGIELDAFEVEAIMAMDGAVQRTIAESD